MEVIILSAVLSFAAVSGIQWLAYRRGYRNGVTDEHLRHVQANVRRAQAREG